MSEFRTERSTDHYFARSGLDRGRAVPAESTEIVLVEKI